MAGISRSVGKGGVNQAADVKLVQQLLAGFIRQSGGQPLNASGMIDNATINAILQFQAKALKLLSPDGRVDPGGRTITALLKDAAKPGVPAPPALGGSVPGTDTILVTYSSGVPPTAQLVSSYSIGVIRKALAAAGMKAAVMTSTLRLPQEQAATMYKNAAKNLTAQFQLYGPTGDEILQVYKANKDKPADVVIALMKKKIEEQLAKGKQVSRHVTTPQGYASLNVIDIGVNSTRAAAPTSFNQNGLTKAFAKLASEGYIKTFIDETAKSNTCWHLEIVPNAKPL